MEFAMGRSPKSSHESHDVRGLPYMMFARKGEGGHRKADEIRQAGQILS